MLPVIALYVYLASMGTNLVSGGNDPKQITASVIGIVTALMAIAYTTKLMYGTLLSKTAKPPKSAETNFPEQQKADNREQARR